VVTEYKPFVHRLRLVALGLGPTNPERINLPQEPLGFRWASFSLAFTLLIPAFSLLYAPRVFPVTLLCCTERSPTTRTPLEVRIRSFGVRLEPRVIFGAGALDQ